MVKLFFSPPQQLCEEHRQQSDLFNTSIVKIRKQPAPTPLVEKVGQGGLCQIPVQSEESKVRVKKIV